MPTGIGRVLGHIRHIDRPTVRELGAELLTPSEAAVDVVHTHSTETAVSVARVLLGALLALCHLGQVGTALDGVDEDVA